MTYGLKVGGVRGNVTISNNNMNVNVGKCGTIAVTATADYSTQNNDATITVDSNNIYSSNVGIQVNFKNKEDIVPNRDYIIKNNIVKGIDQAKYAVFVDGGVGNQDSLEYTTPKTTDTANVTKSYARVASLTSNSPKQVLQQTP